MEEKNEKKDKTGRNLGKQREKIKKLKERRNTGGKSGEITRCFAKLTGGRIIVRQKVQGEE